MKPKTTIKPTLLRFLHYGLTAMFCMYAVMNSQRHDWTFLLIDFLGILLGIRNIILAEVQANDRA